MKVSEQIAIMKAYEDGKTIEGKRYEETEWKSLEYVENYPFDFVMNDYRIATEPKYRPYESVEEAFLEAKKHGFWVKEESSGFLILIDSFSEDYGVVYIVAHKAAELLDDFVWQDDGSPCGVKIE
nr:MAG TPA: hypothetical protein [Caudoviricetes sp.]